jgi:hypothetical protein
MPAPSCQAYLEPGATGSVLAIKDENTLVASSATWLVSKWNEGTSSWDSVAGWGLGSYSGQAGWSVERPVDNNYLLITASALMAAEVHRVRFWGANAAGSPYVDATDEPDLYEVILCTGCPDPGYTKELPRGTTREFGVDGSSPGPSVDAWEIWRCGELVDSGSGIGQWGVNGWRIADGVVYAYSITAPSDAPVTYGYQARIERPDGTTTHVVNFNVIEYVSSAGAGIMPERPIVFEAAKLVVETTPGTALTPNRKLQAIGISVPTPIQPQQEIFQVGGLAAVDVVNQKGHAQAAVGGPMSFEEMIWMLASLLETPTIITPAGATTARDVIFRPKQSGSDDAFKTFTAEIGSDDFASLMAYALLTSGGLTLAGNGNSFEGQMIGRLVNESATPTTTGLTDISLVPLSPSDNNHYIASSVAGLSAGILDRVLSAQIAFGTRRSPLFVQKSADTSFSAILAQRNAETLATLEMMHNSTSIGYLTNLRSRDLLYYRFKNTGPLIEAGFNYEFEVTLPFKFQNPGRGERDNATMGGYNLRPIYKSDFEPTDDGISNNAGGFLEVRIRAPFTAFP